jgi:hypothetical protein
MTAATEASVGLRSIRSRSVDGYRYVPCEVGSGNDLPDNGGHEAEELAMPTESWFR